MKIRKACLEDARGVFELASSIRINYESPQESGFLVSVLDYKQYEENIRNLQYFYVAEDKAKLVGYLMCYNHEEFRKLRQNGNLTSFILRQQTPYLVLSQIVVKRARRGIGNNLIKKLTNDVSSAGISTFYAAILYHPVQNTASILFFKALEFRQIEEVKNQDDKIWGVYVFRDPA